MNILYFLVGCSVVMALLFLAAFFWAYKSGQHDDVHTPGIRVLFDDEPDGEKDDGNHFSN
ncbi:cbb3-type cytochrome oxidase assembly protein CcoS [Pedobacter frigidisoli]|uniref:cbb3-type cytochrome oxidase assembly protein CcoS n=1 Tax=Pedobacter frigidisoli TaxID=2530455 RepID=UPI0029308804|nr:cbb3-type cytochrome oxidase assembly protein CcoS [Pedobacter frigidisoli]